MTTVHRPRRISLRRFAVEVNSHHSTIGTAVRDGRLRDGVVLERGRVVVIDADAAARNWHMIHTPQILELERLERTERSSRSVAAANPGAGLHDTRLGRRIDAVDLFAERNALALLVSALASEVLIGVADRRVAARALQKRIAQRLRAVAEDHGADADEIRRAERELDVPLAMLLNEVVAPEFSSADSAKLTTRPNRDHVWPIDDRPTHDVDGGSSSRARLQRRVGAQARRSAPARPTPERPALLRP